MSNSMPIAPGNPQMEPVAPPLHKAGLFHLSPITRRRWNNFKANRRGYWSLWIFGFLFICSLFAEFIANDRPIVASYKGEILFPVLIDYPEEKFGGFLADTDYRDKTIADEINAHGWMVWPLFHFSYKTNNYDIPVPAPAPPTWMLKDEQCRAVAERKGGSTCRDLEWNWLGTDDQGRDIVARMIYGFRLSVLFGLILTTFSSIIGIFIGAVQGYYGGWVDLIVQRFIEIWNALPSLYLLIILSSFFTPSFALLLLILLAFEWVGLVAVVRAEFLRGRNFEYIRAAKALGLRDRAIMFRHLLPNAMVACMTFIPFILNGAIASLTSLDYIGLGLPPGSASLGELLLQGRSNLSAPWIGLSAFVTIATLLSLLIFIGEAFRDALDPRKSFR